MQDTETMLNCYLVYVAHKKQKYFPLYFRKISIQIKFLEDCLQISTTAFHQNYIKDTIEVNYLIKHECFGISVLCTDRVKDLVVRTNGIKYTIKKYIARVLNNFRIEPRLNLLHITEMNLFSGYDDLAF